VKVHREFIIVKYRCLSFLDADFSFQVGLLVSVEDCFEEQSTEASTFGQDEAECLAPYEIEFIIAASRLGCTVSCS
jgi:hypothetical protein